MRTPENVRARSRALAQGIVVWAPIGAITAVLCAVAVAWISSATTLAVVVAAVAVAGGLTVFAVRRRTGASLIDRRTGRKSSSRMTRMRAVIAIALAVVAAVSVWAVHGDRADRGTFEQRIAEASARSAAAVLSYRWQTVASDVAAARDRLTGGFLAYYADYAERELIPQAQKNQLTVAWTAQGAATESANGSQVRIVAFLKGTVKNGVSGSTDSLVSAVRLTVQDSGGAWLIDDLVPV